MKKVKQEIITTMLGIIFIGIFVYIYYLSYNRMNIIDSIEGQAVDLSYSIDEIRYGKLVSISGWAVKPGADLNWYDTDIILWDDKNNRGYVQEAQLVKRYDVTQYFDDSNNYDNSGFMVFFRNDKNQILSGNYELIIRNNTENGILLCNTGIEIEVK